MSDLYRFYDDAGNLLYVGISLHAAQRASQHRADKAWWPDVARMEVEHHAVSRDELERIERAAIIAERPRHNKVFNQPSQHVNPADYGVAEFDASWVGDVHFQDIASAIDSLARALDKMQRDGAEDVPRRSHLLDAINGLARSVVYGDMCHECGTITYPCMVRNKSRSSITAGYRCCGFVWTCNWTSDLSALAAV